MERTKIVVIGKRKFLIFTYKNPYTLNVLLFIYFFLSLFCFYQIETTRNKKEIIHTHCTFCTRSDLLYCRHHHHTRFPVRRARAQKIGFLWFDQLVDCWIFNTMAGCCYCCCCCWFGLVGFAYTRFCLLIAGKRASFLFD